MFQKVNPSSVPCIRRNRNSSQNSMEEKNDTKRTHILPKPGRFPELKVRFVFLLSLLLSSAVFCDDSIDCFFFSAAALLFFEAAAFFLFDEGCFCLDMKNRAVLMEYVQEVSGYIKSRCR